MDYGIGSGANPGFLWMKSSDGNWYELFITGSSGSAAVAINQTPLTWQDNSLGYQLLKASSSVYPIFLTGNSGSVTLNVSQSAWGNNLDFKPYLFMKSVTDQCFYVVSASVSASVVSLAVNQNSKIFLNL